MDLSAEDKVAFVFPFDRNWSAPTTALAFTMSESLNAKTDEELLCLLQLGKEEAFEVLYARYQKSLYTFILHHVRNADLAQDLFQETFLRLYQKSRSFKRRASVKTWLYAIARNLCLNRLSRTREEAASEPLGDEVVDASEGAEPGVFLERAELLQSVEAALHLLPPAQRELLILSRLEGLSYKEIARVVGSSPGAVKVAAFRALQALREKLNARPRPEG